MPFILFEKSYIFATPYILKKPSSEPRPCTVSCVGGEANATGVRHYPWTHHTLIERRKKDFFPPIFRVPSLLGKKFSRCPNERCRRMIFTYLAANEAAKLKRSRVLAKKLWLCRITLLHAAVVQGCELAFFMSARWWWWEETCSTRNYLNMLNCGL